jgi:hypothetical protein
VLDYLFKGIATPLVGNFSVDLAKFKERTKRMIDKKIIKTNSKKSLSASKRQAQAATPVREENKEKMIDLEKAQPPSKGTAGLKSGEYQRLKEVSPAPAGAIGIVSLSSDSMAPKEGKQVTMVIMPQYQHNKEIGLALEVNRPDER